MRRPWWGPPLDDDQRAVLDLVDDLTAERLHRAGDEQPDDVDRARETLAAQGLWTLGVEAERGGGGADLRTTLVALARLAGTWPALAWASVQAHAAAMVPSARDGVDRIHGGAPVAVAPVDADGPGDRLAATLDRIDPAGRDPLVVLLSGDTALAVPPENVAFGPPVRRTGLDGALTVGCAVDVALTDDVVVRGPAVARARSFLDVGAAAMAAGIAESAAQAAHTYSDVREQFGAPLTALPTVRASLSAQETTVRGLLATSVAADIDRPAEAAAAVAPAFEAAIDVAAAAVQSHGGYGYMAEYGVEGLLRDAVSLRAAVDATASLRVAADALAGGGA
ncbi:Acyl-CoA dehydrogenase [Prauserella aidingensis]|uniref:acyl-CoA dehydrogenase family protein n=1 Tax=Prauserella aidingensis TaxID=387890 RepID=UPI0020A4CBCE|nr:acyl-CoA dehydrogenase family protein [Prauserella aidingensis]MCP2252725.1 Acyl-CoA dehydrogenase [Prauserella aidingensis]